MISNGSIRKAKELAVGGSRKRCSIGKSCSATCIQGVKVCLVDLPDTVSASIGRLSKYIQNKTKLLGRQAEKVVPGFRGRYLSKRKEKYNTIRDNLVKQIEKASLRGDQDRALNLSLKLKNLQGDIKSKLKVPGEPLKVSISSNQERRGKYFSVKDSIIRKMSEAGSQGRRSTYEKWEKILLNLEKKAGDKFGDTDLTRKGDGWKFTSGQRSKLRLDNYRRFYSKKETEVHDAARSGDFARYRKAEDALIKMEKGAGKKLSQSGETIKNRIWRDTKEGSFDRMDTTHDKVANEIMKAIANGNRARYDKLEKIIRKIERSEELSSSKDFLYINKGQIWRDYKGVADFSERMRKDGIEKGGKGVKGIQLSPRENGEALNINSVVNGNKLKLEIYPDSFSFMINGRYTASSNMSVKDQVALVKEIKRQFNIVIGNFKDSIIEVSAARGDGREEMRENAYQKIGFSKPDSDGYMYGRITNGKISPATESDFDDQTITGL